MSSIFTRIIHRELPAEIVWEDTSFIVIMDVNPVSEGHLLVIPKIEEDSIFSLPNDTYDQIWNLVRWLEKPLLRAIGCPRIGIAVEGYGVPHVHVHMVPVYRAGDLDPHRARKATEEELREISGRVRSEIEKEPTKAFD
jgi:histidine triad (HIT) family protein